MQNRNVQMIGYDSLSLRRPQMFRRNMKRCSERCVLLFIILLAVLVINSCAVPINPNPENLPHVEKVSTTACICLYLSDRFSTYVYNKELLGEKISFDLGRGSSNLLESALRQIYSCVSVSSDKSRFIGQGDLNCSIIVEPEIESFETDSPIISLGYGKYKAVVRYKIHIYDLHDKELSIISEVGLGEYESTKETYPKVLEWMAKASNMAIEDGVGKIAKSMSESEVVRSIAIKTQPIPKEYPYAKTADQGILAYNEAKRKYFEDGDFKGAADRALKSLGLFKQCDRGPFRDRYVIDACILAGAAYFQHGKREEATALFKDALTMDPSAEPDRLMYSSELRTFFREVKENLKLEPTVQKQPKVDESLDRPSVILKQLR